MAQAQRARYGQRSNALGIAVTLGAGVAALWMYRPFVEYQRLAGEIGALQGGIAQLEVHNAELRETVEALDTPRGMELKLRELGWARTNERVVRTIPSYTRSATDLDTADAPGDLAGRVSSGIAGAVRRFLRPGRSDIVPDRPA